METAGVIIIEENGKSWTEAWGRSCRDFDYDDYVDYDVDDS
jgi:hypothetical protein